MNLPFFFARRYLFARKSHGVINIISGVGVVGMAIGTAALVVILSVFNGFNRLVADTLGDIEPDIRVSARYGKFFEPDSAAFDLAYRDDRVLNMTSVLEENVFLSYDGKEAIAKARGVDEVYEEESPLRDHIVDGTFTLRFGEVKKAVLGTVLARGLGVSTRFSTPLEIYYPDRGGKISLSNPAASLKSIRVNPSGIVSLNANYDGDLVVLPLESMRDLLGCESEVSAVEIRLVPGASEKDVKDLIKGLSEAIGSDFRVEDRYHQNLTLYKMMRYEKLAIYLILIFVVIIIGFNIFSALTMLLIEKEGDIRTLGGLGAPAPLIRRIFVLEGWLTSLIGLAIGLAAGVAIVLLQQKTGFVRMPGNFLVSSYPVELKVTDLLWTAFGVALAGYLMAILPTINKNRNI